MIPTGGSLQEALAFHVRHLGFSIAWQTGNMAGIRRDEIACLLVENANREWADNASFSIGVSDLEGLYQEYRDIPALESRVKRGSDQCILDGEHFRAWPGVFSSALDSQDQRYLE